MDINQKTNCKSRKQSFKLYILQTEQPTNNTCSFFDINMKERNLLTAQNIDNKQRLLDFISDKNKLSLKSYFDHKGTKEFLNGKNEAMKKIELNENIDNEECCKSKTEKKTKKSMSKKNIVKQKTVGFNLKNNSYKKSVSKRDSSKKNNLKKKHNSISAKYLSNYNDKNMNTLKEKFDNYGLEERSNNNDGVPHSPAHSRRKKRNSIKRKIKKKTKNINIDKSINSINTVNSKLFNNEKEYENFKHLLTKDDVPILEDILYELDVNK